MFTFILSIIICFVINIAISLIVSFLVPGNYYLAAIITSIVTAFVFAIITSRDRRHFYKDKYFWIYFFSASIIFLLVDLLTFII